MSLLSTLDRYLQPGTVDTIAQQIGSDRETTSRAISAAVPLLVGAMARNAQRPGGAQTLAGALERDHDGSLLERLGGLLGAAGGTAGGLGGALGGMLGGAQGGGGLGGLLGGILSGGSRATNGGGILDHVLGGKRGAVEDGLSRATGMDKGKVVQLLVLLAPLVMSALGKMKREKNLGPDELARELRDEEGRVAATTPGVSKSGLLDFLDRDGDGSVADDVAKLGAALGGAHLFGKATRRG